MVTTLTAQQFIGEIEGRIIQGDTEYTIPIHEMEQLREIIEWTLDARSYLEEFHKHKPTAMKLLERLPLEVY
jgi:hypothetical protein